MHRRFLCVLALLVGLTTAVLLQAQAPQPGAKQPDAKQPDAKQPAHFGKHARFTAMLVDCMSHCAACAKHCGHMVSEGKKDHFRTMELCADCSGVCSLGAQLAASHSPVMGTYSEACGKICDKCAEACEKVPNDEMMRACARSCRDCAKACREASTMETSINPDNRR